MKSINSFSTIVDKYTIQIVNLISLLFIFRGSLPAFKYPFIILYGFTFAYLVLSGKFKTQGIRQFLTSYQVIFVLIIIECVAFFLTYKLYLDVFKDLINTLVLLSIAFLYTVFIKSGIELKNAIDNLISWVIGLSALIAMVWIFDFMSIYMLTGKGTRLLDHGLLDYNFATIPAFFGFFSILYRLPRVVSKLNQYHLTFLILLLYLQMFLSPSRRCFIISNTLLIILIVLFLLSFFLRKEGIKKFAKSITPFLLILLGTLLSGYLFLKHTSFDHKTALLRKIGIENSVSLANKMTENYLRFVKIIDPEKNSSELFNEIWAPNLDAKDPESGWGKRIHKTIYPLKGQNSEIIPEGVKGYKMDKTCDSWYFKGNSYSSTNVDMDRNLVLDNDTIKTSVLCFVSEEYDGDEVFIQLSDKNGSWIGYASYNLENKGIWQELAIQKAVTSGRVSTNIYFVKNRASSFSNLKGYVIFAYPQFTNLSQVRHISVKGSENITVQSESSPNKTSQKSINPYFKSEAFTINPIRFLSSIPDFSGGDPIRKIAEKLFPKDTSYLPYKSNLQVVPISYKLGDERIFRWQFAFQIFKKEYDWRMRLFGGGFSFLNWYGFYFLHDKSATDYPHNPFLHILLYSGIIGLSIYILFLYYVFKYYIRYRRESPLLFIFFIITFYFTFFSSGTPFDPPLMGFFSILPFLIHSIHKKEEKALNESTLAPADGDKEQKNGVL